MKCFPLSMNALLSMIGRFSHPATSSALCWTSPSPWGRRVGRVRHYVNRNTPAHSSSAHPEHPPYWNWKNGAPMSLTRIRRSQNWEMGYNASPLELRFMPSIPQSPHTSPFLVSWFYQGAALRVQRQSERQCVWPHSWETKGCRDTGSNALKSSSWEVQEGSAHLSVAEMLFWSMLLHL